VRGFGLRGRASRDLGRFGSSNSWTNLDAELRMIPDWNPFDRWPWL
jgi:hypothetical protein